MVERDFTPRLGKIRTRGGKQGERYVRRLMRGIALAGGGPRGFVRPARGFSGSRIGRGAGIGRILARQDRYGGLRARRVVIKTRIVRLSGQTKSAQLHLRYLQRDGVTREGSPGEMYGSTEDRADGKAFLERGTGDRHQFRFIVAAEDAVEYPDLKTYTRRLMQQVETDLATKLDWVAVDHHNTGHPHTHIVVRGVDDRGKDLIIARDYIAHGMRVRAAEIVTLDLGPRTDLEIETRLRQEVEQDRFTEIDRSLIRSANTVLEVDLRMPTGAQPDRFDQSLRAGRLQKLKRMRLATETAPGQWTLSAELEPTLRRLGERDDIIKTLHRAMAASQTRQPAQYAIYDPTDSQAAPLVGRVVERGLADEMEDRHYLIVDALDGRAHYVDIGRAEAIEPTPAGAIVNVTPRVEIIRTSDRTIAEIAARHAGDYSEDIHRAAEARASPAYIRAHVRRLEALRRAGVVERTANGVWRIPSDYLQRIDRLERTAATQAPVQIETLSSLPLETLAAAEGATWLDRRLVANELTSDADRGFARDVKEAAARRRQWLLARGLAEMRDGQIVFRRNMLATLRRQDLIQAARQLARESGRQFVETGEGQRVDGIYRRRIDLSSGRFAVVEKSREFTLAPWRPVLDRHVGKNVSGIVKGDAVSWTIGRPRAPTIS